MKMILSGRLTAISETELHYLPPTCCQIYNEHPSQFLRYGGEP